MVKRIVLWFLVLAALAVIGGPVRAQMTFKPGEGWQPAKSDIPEMKGPGGRTDRIDYQQAQSFYQAGNAKTAIRLCNDMVETYKTGPWVERAMLLKARACLAQKNLKEAETTLLLLEKNFPATTLSSEISDVRMAIGNARLADQSYTGVKTLEGMVENDPYGARSDEAQFNIAMYYFKKGDYSDASQSFALVVAHYKDSRYREDAMFLRAKATYLTNDGPPRDPLPYEEARDGLREYLRSYPNGKNAAEAQTLLKKINEALACKLYQIAEYYRGQNQKRAAERYYRSVVRNYPDSTWAAKAQSRLPKGTVVEPRAENAPEPAAEPKPAVKQPTEPWQEPEDILETK
jgi:outer membrane assembly lipoprotein YfiO